MHTRLPLRHVWTWWTARRLFRILVKAVLLGSLAVGGVFALRTLGPVVPAQVVPGQLLATDIVRAVTGASAVQYVSGAYLPQNRLLLYTRTGEASRERVRSWALVQLEPFAERLAALPAGEALTWMIDFGPAPWAQETIIVPLRHVGEPSYYRYISADSAMFAGATDATPAAQPEVAQGEPAGQPAPATQTQGATAAPPTSDQPQMSAPAGGTSGAENDWIVLSGQWSNEGSVYSQRDNSGYDFISLLNREPQSNYRLDVKLRLGEGKMGGGFVYNAPSKSTRAGAQSVDFDKQGAFLRWGRYDDQGAYIYQGGVTVDPPINDGQWHALSLVTQGATSVVSLDGRTRGTLTNVSQSGYYGLVASVTKVDFDAMQVTAQAGGNAAVVAPASWDGGLLLIRRLRARYAPSAAPYRGI